MVQITIHLPDERWAALQKKATRLGVAPQDLVRVSGIMRLDSSEPWEGLLA